MANNVKLLSGKQLVENGGKKSDSFLPDKGPKSVFPNNSWLEKKQIESALEDRKFILNQPRIEKRGTLTQAEWINDKQKALVKEKKGSQWLHMGQTQNFCTYLLPEETLHLMEMNSLELRYDSVPVSIQQAYSLLLGKSVTLEEYRVYSLLSRQGYKLIRHDETRIYDKGSEVLESVQNKLNENEPVEINNMQMDTSLNTSNNNETKESAIESKMDEKNTHVTSNLNDLSHDSDMSKAKQCDKDDSIKNVMVNDDVISCQDINSSIVNKDDKQTEKEVRLNCIDIDDSSSDDCVMIAESIAENGNNNPSTINVNVNDQELDHNMSPDESDTLEVECLPSFSFKLKILDSIPNCYRKNFIFLKAPNEKFIPSNIKLSKENYAIFFDRLSNKNNIENDETNYSDSQPTCDLTLKSITNFRHNDRNGSNHCHRSMNRNDDYNPNNRYPTYNNRTQFQQYAGSNNFANNAYFFNHIFQNMTRQRACFANNFPQMSGLFSRFNNFTQRPFFFPQLNRQCFASNFFTQPSIFFCHSRQQFIFQNGCQQTSSNQNNFCNGRENISFPPVSAQNDNVTNQQRRINSLGYKKSHKRDRSISKHGLKNNFSSKSLPNKKTECVGFLCQIEALVTKFSSIPSNEQTKELKDALNLAVCKFNSRFNENYMLEFVSSKCILKKPFSDKTKFENDKVLQLSSDSDCSPIKKSRNSNDLTPSSDSEIKKKCNRRLRAKRSKSDCHLIFQVNTLHSSSESDTDCHSDSSFIKKIKLKNTSELKSKINTNSCFVNADCVKNISDNQNNKNVEQCDDKIVFGNWYPKNDSWNKPIHSLRKPKHSHLSTVNIKISNAILNNIREMSYEKTYSIESWSQAKKLFDSKNNSNTVCISDDESTPNETNESVLSGNISIKIDKTHPLVRPQDCTSVTSVLERLQIIKSAYEDNIMHKNTNERVTLKISYDMYMPSCKNLRKSNLPSPAFSIIILSDKCPLPSPEALSGVMESLPENVPFLIAIVSFDTVSFIQMEHVNIPNIIKSESSMTNFSI